MVFQHLKHNYQSFGHYILKKLKLKLCFLYKFCLVCIVSNLCYLRCKTQYILTKLNNTLNSNSKASSTKNIHDIIQYYNLGFFIYKCLTFKY